ncbi:MAG: hypothetical protein WC145_08440 [Aliarcobacter sp.]
MAEKPEKKTVGGFEFYASLSATEDSDKKQPYRIKGLASSTIMDGYNSIITEEAISTMTMSKHIPLTVGPDHWDGIANVLGIIGWAKPVVSEKPSEFVIDGYLKPDHPYAASLYADIKAFPGEVKLSIGGYVPFDGAVEEYDSDLEQFVTYINEFHLDHIFVCRAETAVNQDTWIEVDESDASGSGMGRSTVDRHDWGKVLFRASSEVVKSRNKKEKRADMEGTDEQKGFLAGLGQMIAAYAKGELSGRSEAAAKDGTQEGTQEGTEAAATQAGAASGEEAGKVEPEAKPDAPAAKPVEEPAKETTSDAIAEQVLSGVTSAIDKLEKSLGESVADINKRVAAMEKSMTEEDKPEAKADDTAPAAKEEPVAAEPADTKPVEGKAADAPPEQSDIAKLVEEAVAAKYEGLEEALDEHLGVIYGQIKDILGKLEVSMKARGRSSQVPIAGEPASLQDNDTTKTSSVATIMSDIPALDTKA